MSKTSKNLFTGSLGKVAVLLSTFPLWKTLYNLIDAWGNLQMITDYLPRIWQFINTTAGTLVVMLIGFVLMGVQLYRQWRAETGQEAADAEMQNAIYTNAGVMLQNLESAKEIYFFVRVFNGLPLKIETAQQAEGFILCQDKPLPTRPQFSLSSHPFNDRRNSLDFTQKVDKATAASTWTIRPS